MTSAQEVAARVRVAADYAQGRTVPWVEISRNVAFWADVLLLCDEIDRLQTAVEPHFLSGVVVSEREPTMPIDAEAYVYKVPNGFKAEILFDNWTLYGRSEKTRELAVRRAETLAKKLSLVLTWENDDVE